MVHPTAAARLVAPAGGALSLMTDLPRTAAGTVNLAAVAAAADEYLRLAANAQEQPGWPFRRLRQAAAWTPSATGGIMSRHACSAPCGARRRTRAWQFRSAPCLPIGRLSSRHCALETRHSAATERAAQAGLWICGQRTRGVAHIPTGAANDSQHQVDCFEGRPLRPYPSPAGDYQPKRSDQLAQATAPSLRGSGQPSTLWGGTDGNGPDALRRGVVNACLEQVKPRGEIPGFFFTRPRRARFKSMKMLGYCYNGRSGRI